MVKLTTRWDYEKVTVSLCDHDSSIGCVVEIPELPMMARCNNYTKTIDAHDIKRYGDGYIGITHRVDILLNI